jgi:hypothetical protein
VSREIAWLSERDDDDPGRIRTSEDYAQPEIAVCDACGKTEIRQTLAGVGRACSDYCMNRLCLQHEAAMARR